MALGHAEADRITVRQLLSAPVLHAGALLGGQAGLDMPVTGVQIAPRVRESFPIRPGVILVLDGDRMSTDAYFLDLALRWAADAGAAMVLVTSPSLEIRLSPRRLASRLSLPLVKVDADLLTIADELRDLISEPERNLSRLIVSAVAGMSRIGRGETPAAVLSVIDAVLDAASCLVGIDGAVVAGPALERPLGRQERIPVSTYHVADHRARAVHPIALAGSELPSFWLVTEKHAPTAFWREAAATILEIASRYLVAGLMSERLSQERDARFRLGVLNAIIASEGAEPALLHQIGVTGWKVEGWCTAVHVKLTGDGDELRVLARTESLQTALAKFGIIGALIERADGWTFWTFADREPSTSALVDFTRRMRRAMSTFAEGYEDMRLATGVGRPAYGIAGLRRSLSEAQQAATLAQAAGGASVVHNIDELGVERILLGWYSSAESAEIAEVMLRPITENDSDGSLLRTLEVYLDSESSPTITADLLGLHRNTVMNRLTRIRELLLIDLDEADQRLAIQLACRTVKIGR